MIKYQRWPKTDLKDMAEQRHLLVPSSAKSPNQGPAKRDYITALKEAGGRMVVDFMEFSPEIRNRVYRELLCFGNSWNCYPQILCTSNKVNKEASSFLYGDNLTEVKIWKDVVQAHGKKCGNFQPTTTDPRRDHITALEWPDFLKRAQWIRFSLAEPDDATRRSMIRADTISQVLYSLCSFLQGKHKTRSFQLDVRCSPWSNPNQVGELDQIRYPLIMLGELKELTIQLAGVAVDIRLGNALIRESQHHGILDLIKEAEAHMPLLSLWLFNSTVGNVSLHAQRNLFIQDFHSRVRNVTNFLRPSAFFNGHWESEVREAEEALREAMDAVDEDDLELSARAEIAKIEQQVKSMKSMRAARGSEWISGCMRVGAM